MTITLPSITTPARRMVRTAHTYSRGWRVFFDGDGQEVVAIYDPENRSIGPQGDSYAVEVSNPPALTQRRAQDELDALAQADVLYPGNRVAARRFAGDLLAMWRADDGVDGDSEPRERTSARQLYALNQQIQNV
ncbi:hypothetical protein [Nocardia sp. NPDC050435]|uniref:hypothetical protein n=1 Tax=Nocardia sp. NPDC050435 TaxID=3155040 RepID=UPI0033DFB2F1